MSHRFFGGDPWGKVGGKTNLFKTVQPLKANTFKEFFDSFIYLPIKHPITRGTYEGLNKKGKEQYKFVPFYTPATFRGTGGVFYKRNESAICCNLVCLDIDPVLDKETKEEISHPAKPYADNPRSLHTLLEGLNFIVHKTISHTPESPRLRVIVEAENLSLEQYPQAVDLVASRLGLKTVTVESKKVAQAMFRPTVFKDTDLDRDNPVIASSFEGQPLTGAKLGTLDTPEAPQEDLLSSDGLEFLKPRADGVSLSDVKSAMKHISPNCSMNDWVMVAMALKHQFPDDEDNAFQVFDQWSAPGETYEGTDKTRYRWGTLKANTWNRLPVTIRTLFKMAKDAGWENPEVEQRYYDQLIDWLSSAKTSGQLVEKGLERIITTPLVSPIMEGPLLKHIKQVASKKFKLSLDLPPLKARLKALRAQIAEKSRKQQEKEDGVPSWATGFIYVSKPKLFYKFTTLEAIERDSVDSTFGVKLLPTQKELEQLGEPVTRQKKSTPMIRPQDYLLNEIKVPRVYDFLYCPSEPDNYIVSRDGVSFVNTYKKSYPEADPKTAKEQAGIFNAHLECLIAEKQYREYVLDFISFMVQNPGQKIRFAVLIQSAKGNGKGLISKALRGVFGSGNVSNVDPETIFSSYNDWCYGSQLVIMNEIRVTGHSRHDVMNKLKEPIADDWVSINQKYRDHRQVENVTNYIMFTNAHDALAVDPDERRYFIIKSPLQTAQHIRDLNTAGRLEGMKTLVDSQQFGGLRHYFENREISDSFDPQGPPPVTPYLKEMQEQSGDALEKIFSDLINDGNPYLQEELVSSTALLQAINREMETGRTNSKGIANLLLGMNYINAGRYRVNGDRHAIWIKRGSMFEGLDLGEIMSRDVEKHPGSAELF
jgi:hypothetical protein